MRRVLREIGFAFLAWLLPFVLAVCLSPLKKSNAPLFESLMGVVLAASTVMLGCAYLHRASPTGNALFTGLRIGLTWMVANWLLDALMFSGGPMKMTLPQYAADIGSAYLMIPVVTTGLGLARRGGLRQDRSA